MPAVSPINVTVDAIVTALSPVGGQGNGSMNYRDDERHIFLSISPRPGNGKTIPDRCSVRGRIIKDVPSHLDASVTVEREAFFRIDSTLPADGSITSGEVKDLIKEALDSDQVYVSMGGETIYG